MSRLPLRVRLAASAAVALVLVLAALGVLVYVLAGAALRPVEAMRRRAAQVTATTPGERLPLPVARDELRRLGATLNEMLDRLDEGLLRERRFVADASHELRTPLSALQVELELALRRPRTAEELTTALRAAAEDVQRLLVLAEDLLALAAGGQGGQALRREPVPARALVEEAAARAAGRARQRGRDVRVGQASDVVVSVDRRRVDRALDALVDNALRHGAGRVHVASAVADGALVLTVTDEGPGLSEQFVPRAFERFSQADAARSSGGAGLGLALVREVALAHGGDARVTAPASVALLLPLQPLP